MKIKVGPFCKNSCFQETLAKTCILKLDNYLILSLSYYYNDLQQGLDGLEHPTLNEVGRESEVDLSIKAGMISEEPTDFAKSSGMSLKR